LDTLRGRSSLKSQCDEKRIFLQIIFGLILSVNLYAEVSSKEVKIGVIVPLSGDMSLHGVEVQRAMRLALDKADSNNLGYDYKLIFEDNRLDAAKSVAAAQKLINLDHVDAIVTLWPPTAVVVAPLTERAGILHYTIAWDPDLAKQNKLVLSHQVMVSDIARRTLALLKQQGKDQIAFFHMEESGFNLGAKYIKELASSEGIDLVVDETFNPAETDFRSLIEKAISKKPTGYLIWSVMPSMDLLIRQIKTRDSSAFITGYFDYAEDSSEIQKTPYVSEMFAAPQFVSEYKAKYSDEPKSKAANAFDIMNLLIKAFESSPSKKLSGVEAKNFLKTMHDISGAVGTFSIDSNGNSYYEPVIREAIGSNRKLFGAG